MKSLCLLNYKGTFAMSKAKLILSGIVLFAAVGGAVAFKAQKFGSGSYFLSTATSTTKIGNTIYYFCTLKDWVPTTTTTAPISTYYTTLTTIGTVEDICDVRTVTRALPVAP